MGLRGRPPKLPSPFLSEPELVPAGLRALGSCVGSDPELFFDDARSAHAIAICSGCAVLFDCRAYAVSNEEFGVWGGLTPRQRTGLRGGEAVVRPEARRESAELRADLHTKTHGQVAEERKCSRRLVERVAAAVRRQDEAA